MVLRFLTALTATLFLSLVHQADAQVVNGGFETGTFAGWTVNDPSGFTNIGPNPLFAHSGTYHANLGAEGLLGTLSQNVSTTPGGVYQLSFWLANDSGAAFNEFDVFWNGNAVLNLTNQPVQNYTLYSFTVSATSSSTPLVFQYRNDDDFFRLDDVSTTAVPEPATVALIVIGAAGLVVAARKRKA